MAITNQERVGKGLDLLRDGLKPFVEREMQAAFVTITSNEIRTELNKPEDIILSLVEIKGDVETPRYVRKPFQREPDFGVTSVNYGLTDLLVRAQEPT